MTFGFLLIGAVLLVAAVRNTQGQLFTLVAGDLTGPKNFVYWIVALWLIGAIGYAKPLKTFSDLFLALVVLGILLSNKGFFTAFQAQIGTTATATAATIGGSSATTPAIGTLAPPQSTMPIPPGLNSGLGTGTEAGNLAIGF
jgi:hypothetical protein